MRASRPFPPRLAAGRHSERRIRRTPRGETTARSDLDPDVLNAKLQAHGVERLRGETDLWAILDGSDLRKPHAAAMEGLQRVKRPAGRGTVPGYRTLTAIGLGREGRRGLLYHRLFSSAAPDFVSERAETRTAIAAVATVLWCRRRASAAPSCNR